MAIAEALIGAGASLIGGLFGKKKSAPARGHSITYNRTQMAKLVKDAHRYGFNPLTLVRSGGLSTYSRTETRSYGSGGANGSAVGGGGGGAGEAIGNAIHAGLSIFREDRAVAAQQAQQQQLIDAQLRGVQANAVPMARSFFVPTRVTAGSTTVGGVGAAGSPVVAADPATLAAAKAFTAGDAPTVTNPYHPSTGVEVNPYFADGELIEQRLGDSPWAWFEQGLTFFGDKWWQARQGLRYLHAQTGSAAAGVHPFPYDERQLERGRKAEANRPDRLEMRRKAQRAYNADMGLPW